ncbi:hypothetical protein BX616_000025 [Lobosporangium transversale]|uniref:PROP1-like PPR domain-containing protein n=1 Tax=Lobosporangium transversale TaxID=64571 RepID=A0A1Y2G954_9FUNG|nr:hypothetical protein BCR41DRAFT_362619 [Lobosporangium transversale]KAF9919414.1 hypothetical protein BX616_000025 [Lobosporangium transversale]ORZ04552.1 hypothetical protein BCR41DRAFT_362619 [Lobosporangium transversale]|eukprot:XP_021876598.1 hypothetical protein BCR41DRAFT_362619 [Lobosporangium transversale]
MTSSSSSAVSMLSVAKCISSRSRNCLVDLSKRNIRRIPGDNTCRSLYSSMSCHVQTLNPSSQQSLQASSIPSPLLGLTTRIRQQPEVTWEVFFTRSCGSGLRRSRSLVPCHHYHPQPRNRQVAVHRSFSMKACADGSLTFISEGVQCCPQKDTALQQSLLVSPSCIAVDGVHRGKRSVANSQLRSAHTHSTLSRHHHTPRDTIGDRFPVHRISSATSAGATRRNTYLTSVWSRQHTIHIDFSQSKRLLHSTRSRRSIFSQDRGAEGIGLSLEEKRLLVADLRRKTFTRAKVTHLWTSYTKIVKAQALTLMQSDDVISLFRVLSQSYDIEEATEMMLQVALDVNDIKKQLPQEAFDILLHQTVDDLPAEQIKAMLWQIQGRRRFIAEFIQLCDSNAEIKSFLGLYNRLMKSSFDVDGFSTYYQSRKERAENLGDMVLQWIMEPGRQVNSKVVENLLVFLLDRGVMDKVFSSISSLFNENFSFSHIFYTSAIHRFGRAQNFDYMDATLALMRRQGLEPLEDTYAAIIDAHSKAGNLREAQRVYQELLDANLTPTNQVFGPMLEAVGKLGDYEMTQQLVDRMNSSGVASNEYTISALLQSLSEDLDKSSKLFDELSGKMTPNTVNYNILIRAFQRHGDLDGAFRVFRSMVKSQVKPDQYTFSSILSLFATRGDSDGAEIFWDEMITVHNVVPNVHTYGSMMHVYCTKEDMLSAQVVYREMIQAGIMPNEVIFGTLLNAYARHGDLTQMLSIYDTMRSEGLKPNSYIYSNLLFGLIKDGDMTAARRLYENMEGDGFGHNVLAQTILMKGYLDQGNFKESQEIYKKILRSGLIPNFMTYATLLQAHAKRGQKKQSRAFLNKIMKSRGLVFMDEGDGLFQTEEVTGHRLDTVSDKDLSLVGFQEGHLSTLGTERKPLKMAARPKPLVAFAPLLDAYAREGDVLAGQEMFDEIRARGLQPNTIVYTSLMDAYRRTGDVDTVMRIWNELFDRFHSQWKDIMEHPEKYRPSKGPVAVEWVQDRLTTKASKLQTLLQHPISITLDSLCYSGRISEAKAIWNQLQQMGFEFDSFNWNDYCIALARNGQLMEAFQIVQDKLLPGFESDFIRPPPEEAPAGPRNGRGTPAFGKSLRSKRSEGGFLESIEDDTVISKQPETLFYPRPRTFAALADSLEELLSPKADKRSRYQDWLSEPIVMEPEGVAESSKVAPNALSLQAKRLARSQALIEAKLQPYPKPFSALNVNERWILWSMLRTEYPRVLEALNEGMLVTPPTNLNPSEPDDRTNGLNSLSSTTQRSSNLTGLRQWRRLKSVMKDMERKQFLGDRSPSNHRLR